MTTHRLVTLSMIDAIVDKAKIVLSMLSLYTLRVINFLKLFLLLAGTRFQWRTTDQPRFALKKNQGGETVKSKLKAICGDLHVRV